MKLSIFLPLMQRFSDLFKRDFDVMVVVTQPGSIGGVPCVPVAHANAGIDWDAGKILLAPSVPLSPLSTEEKDAILKSVKLGQSWHAYQDHKRLTARIEALENQLKAAGITPV